MLCLQNYLVKIIALTISKHFRQTWSLKLPQTVISLRLYSSSKAATFSIRAISLILMSIFIGIPENWENTSLSSGMRRSPSGQVGSPNVCPVMMSKLMATHVNLGFIKNSYLELCRFERYSKLWAIVYTRPRKLLDSFPSFWSSIWKKGTKLRNFAKF